MTDERYDYPRQETVAVIPEEGYVLPNDQVVPIPNKENFHFPDDSMDDLSTLQLAGAGMRVEVGISSVIGKRDEQQDAVRADISYAFMEAGEGIAVLCDGMGGLSGGARASKLCADTIFNAFHELPEEIPIPKFYTEMIHRADAAVASLKGNDGKLLNAGTTMVSVAIRDGLLYWAFVGDSRIYIRRRNEFLCMSQDHNYGLILDEKVKRGEMSQHEAERHPKREALISYIGMNGVRYIGCRTSPLLLENGDQIILCSDGLYRTVPEDEIVQILQCFAGEAKDIAEALTQLAMSKGKRHQDNTSVIVLEYSK